MGGEMSVVPALFLGVVFLLIAEKLWRYALVIRFFRRPLPDETEEHPNLVSILQPILSGDPTLARCLEANLRCATRYHIEFWYLLDKDDHPAIKICQDLAARYPERVAGVLLLPPPPEGISPKMFKLIAGQEASQGDVICCLDDDTVLPDHGLEQCLPYLSLPHVGLAFGLPYYTHFGNIWSAYVSCFVNASSLLTYIPYTAVCEPFTINGMFFATRRTNLENVGGFAAAKEILADDFGTAHLFRKHGYTLAQTPIRHGISTHVDSFQQMRSLVGRWFTFPRESLLRHLSTSERAVVVAMGAAANLLPVAVLIAAIATRSWEGMAAVGVFFGITVVVIARLNQACLGNATPPWALWLLTPFVLLIFPFQMLLALLAPQQTIHWRGNIMEAKEGGGFRFIVRRHQ
jgi:ceramide glucosyltransferase